MHQLTCSIVLYKTNEDDLRQTLNSVLQTNLGIKLYLIDNSPFDELKKLCCDNSIEYIFNNNNLGFGKAHNISLQKIINNSKYHLILNPDIKFSKGVLEDIYHFMEAHQEVGQLMPKVYYEDGNIQTLCHLLPRPIDLIARRFFENNEWAKKLNDKYELKNFNYNECINIPNLSGCFMFLRAQALKKMGVFDERFFMYMEDVDLTRRIHRFYKTLFYPFAAITHGYEKESYSNSRLLKHHIISAVKYFNKWGWLFDKERDRINDNILKTLYT
ncbi:MAG: glycosyltransferase [Parafilimonas sp.]